ncbi:colorectal mutant cancer protein [Oryzias melastigma]|uniref:colorectal mutant cancer protein n=1 Tax=Oryzias melastigma TaxID=30732 RepID=UPI000CF7E48E|nr:colorectal mutant cancer protein [Oryzias melastigma]
MEDSRRIRCDSLSAGSGFDQEMPNPCDRNALDPGGSDPVISLEPTAAEVAQCEAEVGTLLSIIAELNKTMGSLKAPSDPGELRPSVPSRPLVPDLLSHRLVRCSSESNSPSVITSKPPLTDRGGSGVVWTKLQEVLTSVEDSISYRRTWAAPITASDQEKQKAHLRAAHENWTKATQMVEEMEKEFGISCPLSLPKEQNAEDLLYLEKKEPALTLQSQQEEQQSSTNPAEEEKNKLSDLRRSRRSGSLSPSYLRTAGGFCPEWASPPYPGSPLLHRRAARAMTPLSVGGDGAPLDSASTCSSPISPEPETERLNRYIERLRARNERLTAALERRKAESEQMSVKLNRLESNFSTLQLALRYSEECEEAYSELLSLYDAERLQNVALQTDSADGDRQQSGSPSSELRRMGTEELSTSFSTAVFNEKTQTQSQQSTLGSGDRETALRQHIDFLKKERAAISLHMSGQGTGAKLSSDPVGQRWGQAPKDLSKPPDSKREKASLFYELISVREEMSDLRALIRLKEKELRCLEWGFMGQKAQEAAGVFIPESLQEEVEYQKTDQQRLSENAARAAFEGDITGPLTRPILKELQAVLQREQALKKRLALVHDSLNTALKDNPSHRKDNGEHIARLTQAHSKALSSYRQIRRKYREQVWRLEQKVAAMMESHHGQSGATREAGEALEWRREETIL